MLLCFQYFCVSEMAFPFKLSFTCRVQFIPRHFNPVHFTPVTFQSRAFHPSVQFTTPYSNRDLTNDEYKVLTEFKFSKSFVDLITSPTSPSYLL